MSAQEIALLAVAVLAVAFLYSSVGHAGASGYTAMMALFSVAPALIKPTALALNVLVATIATWQFWRAGHFSWRLFWPFALLSVPLAFVGGYVNLPTQVFKVLLGLVLLAGAANLLVTAEDDSAAEPPSRPLAIGVGAGLGLLSGLTGTGGGIFLTPLLMFMRWARTKPAAAVSALFILVNSVAGLAGNVSATQSFPVLALPLAGAAIIGGTVGSYYGSRRFAPRHIKRLLAAVLVIAGLKLIFV